MRLDCAVGIERRFVADSGEVEFAEVSSLHIHTPANARAQQTKVPAREGRARKRPDEERLGQMFVQGVEQLIAPDEIVPQRFLPRTIAPDQQPFGDDGQHGRGQSAAKVQKRKQEKGLQQAETIAQQQ